MGFVGNRRMLPCLQKPMESLGTVHCGSQRAQGTAQLPTATTALHGYPPCLALVYLQVALPASHGMELFGSQQANHLLILYQVTMELIGPLNRTH